MEDVGWREMGRVQNFTEIMIASLTLELGGSLQSDGQSSKLTELSSLKFIFNNSNLKLPLGFWGFGDGLPMLKLLA